MPPADTAENKRNDFVWYIKQFLLTPYFWGGDDPLQGIDCSGLAVEGFKSIGIYKENEDNTANGIYLATKDKAVQKTEIKPGTLVFFFNTSGEKAGKATHVAIFINRYQIIHASGGGSKTDTLQEAIDNNAYVKIRAFETEAATRRAKYGQTYKFTDPFKQED